MEQSVATSAAVCSHSVAVETIASDVKEHNKVTKEAIDSLETQMASQKATMVELEAKIDEEKVRYADSSDTHLDWQAHLAKIKIERYESEKLPSFDISESEDSVYFNVNGNFLCLPDHLCSHAESFSRPFLDKPPSPSAVQEILHGVTLLDTSSAWLFRRWLDKRSCAKNDRIAADTTCAIQELSRVECDAGAKFLVTRHPKQLMVAFYYHPR